MWCSIPAGTGLPPSSAIAVGTAGVHGDRVPGAGRPDELPQAVAEVLHLAGTQRTAHTQELGSRPAGTQVSAGAIAERLTPGRGQAGTLLGLEGLVQLPDRGKGCRVPRLRATGRCPGWGLPAQGDGGSKPSGPAFQGSPQLSTAWSRPGEAHSPQVTGQQARGSPQPPRHGPAGQGKPTAPMPWASRPGEAHSPHAVGQQARGSPLSSGLGFWPSAISAAHSRAGQAAA